MKEHPPKHTNDQTDKKYGKGGSTTLSFSAIQKIMT